MSLSLEVIFLGVLAYVVVETFALVIAGFRNKPTGFRVVTYVIMIIVLVILWLVISANPSTVIT